MKKILLAVVVIILILATVLAVKTASFKSSQTKFELIGNINVDDSAKFRMSEAISIPTISNEDGAGFDSSAFYAFNSFVKKNYPLVDSTLDVSLINEFSMIFKWQGNNANLKPIVLMGHIDVVPVPEENLPRWTEPPFSGAIKNGVIWGRGAIDNKISVIGNLEAVEQLLKEGYKPERTLLLCFGHDEELGGPNGAVEIVKFLQSRNVEAEYILDEGGAVTDNMIPGVSQRLALIGTAEKGIVSLGLEVSMEGGHSSMPAKESAIDVLSKAIVALKQNPFPTRLTGPVDDFLNHIGKEMPTSRKVIFANRWLLEPLLIKSFSEGSLGSAMMRTTTAPTIIQAGIKENVIPYDAKAIVNFRILPGSTVEDVIVRVKETINDERVEVGVSGVASQISNVSPTNSFGYKMIDRSIKEVFENTITTPNLVVGGTDSRHYYPISENVYRFAPMYINPDNSGIFHGIDERISVENFENSIRFYYQLIKNSTI